MIIVDSSVWIDYYNGTATPQTGRLDDLLTSEPLATGDLIVAEVLQGFCHDADFATARADLLSLTIYEMVSTDIAIRSAENYRALRRAGLTVRKTTDVIIATFCLRHGHELLFSDRDFLPFVTHFGLRAA